MSSILPQQRLLLELLIMSGDIAISEEVKDSILVKTLTECKRRGWVSVSEIGQNFKKVAITTIGRQVVKQTN